MRTVTLEQMADAVASSADRPRVVVSGNYATPWPAVDAIDLLVPEWTLHMLNAQTGVPVRAGVRLETCFVGPGMRGRPTLAYVPSRLSMVPVLLHGPLAPDAVVVHVAPAVGGSFSLGTEVNILPAAVASARSRGALVVAVVNPRMPRTGGEALLTVDDVDLAVDVERPLPSPVVLDTGPDEQSRAIGERVAARVRDGSTVQAGIGSVPDAVLAGLVGRRGLRVWSEMISDGVLGLDRAGALDPDEPVATSFLFGSPELYAWADGNPRLHMLSTQTANDPARIAARPQMVSVNSALEVDLFAQANAAYVRGRVHSGFGGQSDFVSGALHSAGGQAVIALRSWHPKADCSTIVPLLHEPVTSFQHSAVVTEHGTAELAGRSQGEQADALIWCAADPRVRDELRERVPTPCPDDEESAMTTDRTIQRLDERTIDDVVRAATAAPSILNSQPWRFHVVGDRIDVFVVPERAPSLLDVGGREMHLSVGAALLNLRLALGSAGYGCAIELVPVALDLNRAAAVHVHGPTELSSQDRALCDAIGRRRSSRVPFTGEPVSFEEFAHLQEAASAEGAHLRATTGLHRAVVTSALHEADSAQRADPALVREAAQWTVDRAQDDAVGIPAESLGPVPRDPSTPVRDLALGVGTRARPTADFSGPELLAVLLTTGDERADWLRGGMALERVLLAATVRGLSVGLLSQATEVPDLRPLVRDPMSGWRHPQIVVRFGYSDSPPPATPRLPLGDVLEIG